MGLRRAGAARLRAWETNPFAIEKPKTRTEGESSQPEALRRLPGRPAHQPVVAATISVNAVRRACGWRG